jgi:hypothetical protein
MVLEGLENETEIFFAIIPHHIQHVAEIFFLKLVCFFAWQADWFNIFELTQIRETIQEITFSQCWFLHLQV